MTSALGKPFPRAAKTSIAHQIWHYPGTLAGLNDTMSSAKANTLLYHQPNSIRGAETRRKNGFNSGDNDIVVDRQNQVWMGHWDAARESWVGFHPKTDKEGHPVWSQKNVSQMDSKEVVPLVSLYGGYRMNRIEDYIEYQIAHGGGACFEQKFHPYLRTNECWDKIANFIAKHGGHPGQFMAMTLPSQSVATKFLLACGQSGIKTGVLYRGGSQRDDVRFMVEVGKPTWVKCTASQMVGLDPKGVGTRRMGTSAANATWLGCSVHDGDAKASADAIKKAGGRVGLWPH